MINIEEISRCKEMIKATYSKLVTDLETAKDQEIVKLDTLSRIMKREIDSAFHKAEEHLLDTNYKPTGLPFLFNQVHGLEDKESLVLFHFEPRKRETNWKIDVGVDWDTRLLEGGNVRNLFGYVLAAVRENEICIYTPATQTGIAKPLSRTILNPMSAAASAFRPDGIVLICGFYSGPGAGKKDAYSVDMNSGKVTTLAEMPQAKYSPGLCYFEEFFYSFGGYHNGILLTCEKYKFSDNTWIPLEKNMCAARYYYNPCLHHKLIYLCGGHCTAAEVFSPSENTFKDLGLVMPGTQWTVVFVQGDELIIINGSTVTRRNFLNGDVRRSTHQAGQFRSQSEPILIDNVLYFVNSCWADGCVGVRQFHLSSMTLKENVQTF